MTIARPLPFVPHGEFDTSDEALVARLPGFANGYASVGDVRLHYITGGEGPPLLLVPGHPETWWSYHRIMPALARDFTVIAADIRGMGGSDKPADGYDKRTMAADLFRLVRHLGHDRVNIAGHDVGSQVAFAFAANHPEATIRLALMDVPHPDESWLELPMLPPLGTFGAKVDADHPPYPWWFAFHQVRGLDEALLAGDGMRRYIAWLFGYLLDDDARIEPFDLAVYGDAYSNPDAIRAGHDWYRAWPRDIEDQKTYPKLEMPVLGLGGRYTGMEWLKITGQHATDFELVEVPDSGHFVVMEQPAFVTERLRAFFS